MQDETGRRVSADASSHFDDNGVAAAVVAGEEVSHEHGYCSTKRLDAVGWGRGLSGTSIMIGDDQRRPVPRLSFHSPCHGKKRPRSVLSLVLASLLIMFDVRKLHVLFEG